MDKISLNWIDNKANIFATEFKTRVDKGEITLGEYPIDTYYSFFNELWGVIIGNKDLLSVYNQLSNEDKETIKYWYNELPIEKETNKFLGYGSVDFSLIEAIFARGFYYALESITIEKLKTLGIDLEELENRKY